MTRRAGFEDGAWRPRGVIRNTALGIFRASRPALLVIKLIANGLVSLLWFTVGVGIVWIIAAELSDQSVVVEEIAVPSELEVQGYTSSVVAYQIVDEWREINRVARTERPRRAMNLAYGQVDLTIPGVNISLESIIGYFKDKLGVRESRLHGGIVVNELGEPNCAVGWYRFHMDVEGVRRAHVVRCRPKAEIHWLIQDVAVATGEAIDPYLLANYYYSAKSPECASSTCEDKIEALIEIALNERPTEDDPWAHTLRGAMHNRAHRWAEAVPHFDRALQLRPHHRSALTSRCWARLHLDQLDAAIADCRTALRLNNQSYESMHNLAEALKRKGDDRGAFAVIRCAVRLAPDRTDIGDLHEELRARLAVRDVAATAQECERAFS